MRHGVLIIANNNPFIVKTMMEILDDDNFIFFLLNDEKCPLDTEEFIPQNLNTQCIVLPRVIMNWGAYSYTRGQLMLMEEAVKEKYELDYLHITQGADLPLKRPQEINTFIEKHAGKNFISAGSSAKLEKVIKQRLYCKHILVENKNYRNNYLLKKIDAINVHLQEPFVKNRKAEPIYFHSAVYSITTDFARYFVKKKGILEQKFKRSLLCEEHLAGMLLSSSPFSDTLYDINIPTRFVDWSKGGSHPHVFTDDDKDIIDEAINTENLLFARKFMENVDIDIVAYIKDKLSDKKVG